MDSEFVEIQVTCGSDDEARSIADALVAQRLAACVQQVPIHSTYRWQGTVERDAEILLLVKTTSARIEAIRATVADLHSYDVPAFTAVEIVDGSPEYLAWLRTEAAGP
jgi:periplasmic divalent cation tolerance protein